MEEAAHIGEIIRGLRESKGLRPGQLAYKSGLTKGAIHKIESGKTSNPSAQTIARIVGALSASADYLFQEAGWLPRAQESGTLAPELQEIQHILDAMPPSERMLSQGMLSSVAALLRELLDHSQALRADEQRLRLVAEEKDEYEKKEDEE